MILLSTLWVAPARGAPGTINTSNSPSATEAVKNTITELMTALDDPTLKSADHSEQRRHEIERIVMRRVSYEEMAKRSLGAPWSELAPVDRREFVDLFVQLLRDNFASRIAERSAIEVTYTGEQQEQPFAEVKSRLKGPKVDTEVDFRLLLQSGDWLVYDVVVDGASIVSNYRAQFTSIIRDVSYVGLVKKMKQNAVAVKLFEQPPAH